MEQHPLSSMKAFAEWSQKSFGCVNCLHIEKNELPVDQWKCTHEFAFKPCEDYPKGIEHEKEWLRQDDIKQGLNVGRDINLYFMCFYFKSEKVDLQEIKKIHNKNHNK
jgi:hypothetical protein